MRSRTTFALLAAATAALATAPAAAPAEDCAGVLAAWVRPGLGDFDVYDGGVGLEGFWQRWTGFFGFGAGAGLARWTAGGGSASWDGPVAGESLLLPLGASLLARVPLSETVLLQFEASLRYVFVSGDLTLGSGPAAREVELDPGVAGLLRAHWMRALGTDSDLRLGVAWQFDVAAGSARTRGGPLQDHSLQALALEAGWSVRF
jgi:hypothetical protein